jgi:hypothetical protein
MNWGKALDALCWVFIAVFTVIAIAVAVSVDPRSMP